MHTQFDEYADNKTLLVDGAAEAAVVDFEQTPDMPGGEAEGFGANDSETPDNSGEGESVSLGLLLAQALSPAEGPDPSSQDDAGEADGDEAECEDGATAEATGESGPSDSSTDDSGDEGDGNEPQPCRRTPLPSDIDWRDLKPRAYGKSLPPLDPVERQTLEKSIISKGVLGKILIDEWLDIIEGNTRWEICVEKGIVPEVEVIWGLSEEEKEELALSCNLDRRQLKNSDVERQVLEARFENLRKLRKKDPKTWTQKRVAATLGVSLATISLWERHRHDSNGENASKPDARRKYEEDIEREAVRLVREGMPKADVARKLLMHPKAVERAVNKEKKRESGGGTAKNGKNEKVSTAQSTDVIEAITANDGIQKVHLLALEHIGQDPQAYVEWLEAASAKASKAVEAAADSVEELLKLFLYGSQVAAAANLRLGQLLNAPGEVTDAETPPGDFCPDSGGCKPGDILQGSVMAIEPDEVIVALSDGSGGTGVIDNRGNCVTWKGPLVQGQIVRVRVEGFDSERGLTNLALLGRQSFSHAECANAFGPRLDNLCSPDTELAGLKAGPKEKEVIE
jgi:transposase/DNA-binding transcriptional regulator YiaG